MKTVASVLIVFGSLFLILALVLYIFQERLLFLPDVPSRNLVATPARLGLAFEDVTFHSSDGLDLHGWFIPASRARGTLLFFHGNAGNISHRLDSIAIFHDLGLNVFIVDYRGYGLSEGKPSEQGSYLDAMAAWDYLVGDRAIDPATIVLFGRSLGGAVGAWLAARHTPAAVIVESSFTSAPDMGQRLYPFMPVRLLARIDYPVLDHVARARCPVLVVHSRDDEIIPFDMGQALFEAAPEPKALIELSGDHNGGFLLSGPRYVQGLEKFLGGVLKGSGS